MKRTLDCIRDILVYIDSNSNHGIDTKIELLLNDLSKYDKDNLFDCLNFLSDHHYIEFPESRSKNKPTLTRKGHLFLNKIKN